jgi:tripartite-type tricarboxylate transporter receptor subunit TctC
MTKTFRLSRVLAGLVMLASVAALAQVKDYPNRPIKLLLPLSAGSGGDALGRLIAEAMGKRLNGSFFVENRVGRAAPLERPRLPEPRTTDTPSRWAA